MAITVENLSATNTFANSGSAKTASLTIGGNSNRIVVAFIGMGGATPSTVTFNGVNMTLGKSESNTEATAKRSYIYYMLESSLPSAGSYNLSVTPSAACYGNICCFGIYGALQEAPHATGGGNSNSAAASWANNITPTKNDSLILEVSFANDRTFTPTSPQVEMFDFKDGSATGFGVSRKELTTAALTTMEQTPSSSTAYAQALVALAPAVDSGFFLFY